MAHTSLFRSFIRALQKARRDNLKAAGKRPPLTRREVLWTRRRFLGAAALAAGSALTSGVLPRMDRAWSGEAIGPSPQIAVIGGGIAGLNAAFQLQKAGYLATVYEGRHRLGGRIRSVTGAVGDGLVTDLGGQLINTDHADMLALVEEFGLHLFNRNEDPALSLFPETGYFFDGRSRSEAEVADALRPLAQQIAADAALLDQDFEQFAPLFDQRSVAQYLDEHVDKILAPYIRDLIDNSIRTEYGVEPDESSALQLLFNLPTVEGHDVEVLGNSDETFMVEGGSEQIIAALAQALSNQLRLGMVLRRLTAQGSRFRLTFVGGTVVEVDYVILAIPFTVLRHVDLQVDLPETLRRFIDEVSLGVNEKILAGFHERIWRQEDGFVKEVWTDLGFSVAWEDTQRQPDSQEAALTFFFGGDEVGAIQLGPASAQGRRMVEQLEQVIPGAQDAANDRFLRTRWAQNPFTRGSYTNFKPGQLTTFGGFLYIESEDPDERQDVHVGNLVFAGEHLSDAFYGFMNGAAQTGRLAAQVVVDSIQAQAQSRARRAS
jgi:monoamine oxidase